MHPLGIKFSSRPLDLARTILPKEPKAEKNGEKPQRRKGRNADKTAAVAAAKAAAKAKAKAKALAKPQTADGEPGKPARGTKRK